MDHKFSPIFGRILSFLSRAIINPIYYPLNRSKRIPYSDRREIDTPQSWRRAVRKPQSNLCEAAKEVRRRERNWIEASDFTEGMGNYHEFRVPRLSVNPFGWLVELKSHFNRPRDNHKRRNFALPPGIKELLFESKQASADFVLNPATVFN